MPNTSPGRVLWGVDVSALDPKTIDPRIVGLRAAFENLNAFMSHQCAKNGWLSREDAARGFDQSMAELDQLLGVG